MRNASCILRVCGVVPLGIKQTVQLGDILRVMIWKVAKQAFKCRKLLSLQI